MSKVLERITIDPESCGGRPTIRGMRIRVVDVLEHLASGMSRAEILTDYPALEADDLEAALMYAVHVVQSHPTKAA